VLTTSAAHRDLLVIGVDADAGSMVEASRRAARATKRGGLPSALFVVAAAEALPAELNGRAAALTVHFPWGSLLRGLLDADPAIVGSIARVTRPGATVTMLLSVTERDRSIGRDWLDERTFAALAPRYAAHGLLLREVRPATVEEVSQSHSSWAKRLGAGISRPVWFVRFERTGAAHGLAAGQEGRRVRIRLPTSSTLTVRLGKMTVVEPCSSTMAGPSRVSPAPSRARP
jgi:16S rRNA (adenine(1408)-N(1))-methyltransferase